MIMMMVMMVMVVVVRIMMIEARLQFPALGQMFKGSNTPVFSCSFYNFQIIGTIENIQVG